MPEEYFHSYLKPLQLNFGCLFAFLWVKLFLESLCSHSWVKCKHLLPNWSQTAFGRRWNWISIKGNSIWLWGLFELFQDQVSLVVLILFVTSCFSSDDFFCGPSPLNWSLSFTEPWLDAKVWRDREMSPNPAGPHPSSEEGGYLCLRQIAENLSLPGSLAIQHRGVWLLVLTKWTVLSFLSYLNMSLPVLPADIFTITAPLPPLAAASEVSTNRISTTESVCNGKFVPKDCFHYRTTIWDYKVPGK